MKLSTRLGLVVGCATLGALILVFISLQTIHATMLNDRQEEIKMMVTLAKKQVDTYIDLEHSGTISREEAQARAKEALSGLRNGDDYVFVRAMDATVLVHPDPRKEGKVDVGSRLADGRNLMETYLDAIKTTDFALVTINTKRPNGQAEVPKINGIFKVQEWGWMVGFGLFADDIDEAKNATHFALIALGVLAVVLATAVLMARQIYRALGGEPDYAAAMAKEIADGNFGTDIVVTKGDNKSLMSSLKIMQMKLVNLTAAVQENVQDLNKHVSLFDGISKRYFDTRSDEALFDLNRAVKAIGKTAEVLSKSIARFKL